MRGGGEAADSPQFSLEAKLQGHLHDARLGRFYNLTEQGAIEIALNCGRSEKLSVIKRVEAFDAQLQEFGFLDIEISQQGNIEI